MSLGGFQPLFGRSIHRNFYKMKGKTDQDPLKNAGIPTGILKGCKKLDVFYSPLLFIGRYGKF